MTFRGIERVKINSKNKFNDISEKRTRKALYSILSQTGALATLMTPMDTSNLVNSQYAPVITGAGANIKGEIGYTAAYAHAVHEAPGTLKGLPRAHFGKTREGVEFGGGTGKGNYWDPNGEPGFLRKAGEDIRPSIPKILRTVYGAK